MKKTIKVGDIYRTKSAGNFWGAIDIKIIKVENGDSADGWGYYDTPVRMHNRKHHSARIWWLRDFCVKVN